MDVVTSRSTVYGQAESYYKGGRDAQNAMGNFTEAAKLNTKANDMGEKATAQAALAAPAASTTGTNPGGEGSASTGSSDTGTGTTGRSDTGTGTTGGNSGGNTVEDKAPGKD